MACDKICLEESGSKNILIVLILIPTITGVFLMIISNYIFRYFETKGMKFSKAKNLIFQSIILIIWFGCMSYGVYQYKEPCGSFDIWFNGEEGVTIGTIIVGMFSNIVFGFIDNAGLFFGGVYLEEIFALLPGGNDANVTAGYGNTFSDTLGIFLGTFCGAIISDLAEISDGPIWANAIGIIIGCLLGIFIPKMIISNSGT